MRRARSTRLFSLGLALAFAVCSLVLEANAQSGPSQKGGDEATKKLLLGKWQSDTAVIEFFANGSIKINDEEYLYKVKGPIIVVTGDDGSIDFPYELSGDKLVVEVEGRDVVYTRPKGRAAESAGAAAGGGIIPGLVGKWCYMSNLTGTNSYMSSRCFTLYANGTYEYSAESSTGGAYGSTGGQSYDSGRWTATRTTITAYSNSSGKTVYPIELRNHPKTGDPMIVLDGDAYVTAYQKRPW